MSCEACGGDGQIEVGAYRGDDSPDTRECRLCSGKVTMTAMPTSAENAAVALQRLGQAATATGASMTQSPQGCTLVHKSSYSGSCEVDFEVRRERPRAPQDVAREYSERLHAENERQQRGAETHRHQWSASQPFGPYVRFCCIGCSYALVFSKHGNLSDGKAPDPATVKELSRKAIVFAARESVL